MWRLTTIPLIFVVLLVCGGCASGNHVTREGREQSFSSDSYLYYFLDDVKAERLTPRDYEKMNRVYEHVGYDWTKKRRLYRRKHESAH